jgi:membrane fusion protein, multidrug efflux system
VSLRRVLLVVIPILIAIGGSVWLWLHRTAPTAGSGNSASAVGGGRRGGGANGPVTVVAAAIGEGDLRVSRSAIGTVVPQALVTVRSQLSGHLDRLLFSEGQLVEAGAVLAEIDARPYQLAQAQYEGQRQRDQALLAQAERDLVRYRTLVEQDAIPRQQLETQEGLVAQLSAAIATDTAQIDLAKLDQSYCRITAPIAGRVGLRQVDAGSYVTAGDAGGIVTIAQVQPMGVLFTLAETELPVVLPRVRGGAPLPVQVFDRDGTTKLATGPVVSIDNAIDQSTGTVRLRATVPNADERLFPNQFVQVRLDLERHHAAAVAPAVAIQHGPQGAFVWKIADGQAHQTPVTTGVESGERIEVLQGLEIGDQVVTDGVDRLREGATVLVTTAGEGAATQGEHHRHRPADGEGKTTTGGWHNKKDGQGGDGEGGTKPKPAAGE